MSNKAHGFAVIIISAILASCTSVRDNNFPITDSNKHRSVMAQPLAIMPATASPSKEYEYNELEPVVLGTGWHKSVGTKTVNTCLEFTSRQDNYTSSMVVDFKKVNDKYSMARSISGSASATLSSITAGGSASANWAEDFRTNLLSSYFLASGRIKHAPSYILPDHDVRLKNEYVEMLSKGNRNEFTRLCGDGYVDSIGKSATMNAVVIFNSTDNNEVRDFQNAFEAYFNSGTAGGDVSVRQTNKTRLDVYRDRYTFSVRGSGGVAGLTPVSIEDVIASISKLGSIPEENLRPSYFTVKSYEGVINYPNEPIPSISTDLEKMQLAYWKLRQILNDVQDIQNNQGNWHLILDTKLTDTYPIRDAVAREIERIRQLVSDCQSNIKACDFSFYRDWDDIKYRLKLPVPKNYLELSRYSNSLERLPSGIVEARVRYWYHERSSDDCTRYGYCINQQRMNNEKARIIEEIRSSMDI